ncbi:flagellar hook assembly protein FlgD [Roseateles violae]|uniref:Basal-body rod modification protein FlgD n=1 Tax=Roseateles violae TaxID=3058042 RepID=A0ABT8DWS3_9BURK|nr:flagellar hook capping FlgD N-terminal domain-containing protein [Pelomonas sp. PFR6]MDN3921555.1 flagellar hook capping FlgD N-terminal domain-containing protein [Pelomonas sp. PFR6]
MTTTAVNNNSSGGAVSDAISGNGAMQDMFTKLLVAQIRNQDPMSPQDPAAMVTQLTQMSQMEALQKLNEQGAANASMLSSLQMMSLGSQVGSTVQAQVEQIHLGKQAVQTGFVLQSSASPATLVLTDAYGAERRVSLGNLGVGSHDYRLDPQALGLAEGDYRVRIENEAQQAMPLEVVAELTSVRLTGNGTALLSLSGLADVLPGAITAFKGRMATTNS